jgi:copper chaperone CopZ
MNNLISRASTLLIIFCSIVAANSAQAETKDKTKPKTSTVVFSVTEMGCGTDNKMVETALYRKKGVKSVKIEGETITVTYVTSKVKPEDLKEVIENTGTCEDPNAKVHKVQIKTD